jgi:hypothetical protein
MPDGHQGGVEILGVADLPRLFAERPVGMLHRPTQDLYPSLYIRNAIVQRSGSVAMARLWPPIGCRDFQTGIVDIHGNLHVFHMTKRSPCLGEGGESG